MITEKYENFKWNGWLSGAWRKNHDLGGWLPYDIMTDFLWVFFLWFCLCISVVLSRQSLLGMSFPVFCQLHVHHWTQTFLKFRHIFSQYFLSNSKSFLTNILIFTILRGGGCLTTHTPGCRAAKSRRRNRWMLVIILIIF